MSNKDRLYTWLEKNRPNVHAQLTAEGMTDMKALRILNKESGLEGTDAEVKVLDVMEEGSQRFLSAFISIAMKEQMSARFVAEV